MSTLFRTVSSRAERLTLPLFREQVEGKHVADVCELITALSSHDSISQAKRRLPAVTWQANFPDGSVRSNGSATPTGMFILDFDHVDDPFSLYGRVLPFLSDNVMLAHKTPSGHGLRIVCTAFLKGKTISENIAAAMEKLPGDVRDTVDTVVKDAARLSFLVPSSYIYAIRDSIFDYNQPDDIVFSASPDNVSPGTRKIVVGNKNFPAELNGVKYTDIVNSMVEELGGTPAQGVRNTTLFKLAVMLAPYVDFNAEWLKSIIPDFGLSDDEVDAVINSALKHARLNSSNKVATKVILKLQKEKTDDEEQSSKEIAQNTKNLLLPRLFKIFYQNAPDDFKVPSIFALLPVMGTVCSKIRARYIDGTMHSPSFITAIEAPQASGKSFTRKIVDLCHKTLNEKDDKYRTEEKLYNQLLKKNKNAKQQPNPPETHVRVLPPTVSIAKLLQRMDMSKGLHLFSFSEEMDTLIKTNSAGAWSSKTDIYRNAFDNAVFGQDFMSDNSYSAVLQVFYNLLVCGTPKSFQKMFKNVEDGLVSRICFVRLKDQFGKKMPKWKEMSDKDKVYIINTCNEIDEKFNIDDKNVIHDEYVVDMSKQNKRLEKWLEEQRIKSVENDDRVRDIFRRRAAVIAFRTSMLAKFLLEYENEKYRTQDLNDFMIFIANYTLETQISMWGKAMENSIETSKQANLCNNVYSSLPETFEKSDLEALLHKQGRKTPVKVILSVWRRENLIKDIEKNHYKKIKL